MANSKDVGMTPAALGALLNGDIDNFRLASIPGGIEAQEKAGQIKFVGDQTLPKEIIGEGSYETLEKLGFIIGPDYDNIFFSCEFPDGWTKIPTEHSMWSYVIDSKQRKRIRVFYKGAFYDRRSHMEFIKRLTYGYYPESFYKDPDETYEQRQSGLWYGAVLDQDDPIYKIGGYADGVNERESKEAVLSWLTKNYPDFKNPLAYWD